MYFERISDRLSWSCHNQFFICRNTMAKTKIKILKIKIQ